MTKKDYEMIAELLKAQRDKLQESRLSSKDGPALTAHKQLCECFAVELRTTNKRFNPNRFLTACGY